MNDRFRFRAWNKEDKKMYVAEGVYAYKDEYTQGGEVFLQEFKTSHYFPEQVELMQCTGLKDKNGKLIYEGDIVEVINCRGANAVVEYNLEGAKFILKGEKFAPSALQHIRKDYFKVIGNIYENKELLNENK